MRRRWLLLASVLLVTACVGGSSLSPQPSAGPTPTATAAPTGQASSNPSPSAPPVGSVELARSDLPRATVDPARATVAADAINAFGLDLYGRLASSPGNIVLSPASVAIALSMARAGAVGRTATEMDAMLRDLGAEDLADAANALDAALAARSGTFADSAGESHDILLKIANAIFPQRGMALETSFLDAMATRYGAGAWLLDYIADPEAARQAINAWVSDQTGDRIPEIVKPGQVTTDTRLALANAIYLKAPWLTPFLKDNTTTGAFALLDGSSVSVPMMRNRDALRYGAGTGWRAVELPYVGDALAMTVIVPDDLVAFEASLDAALLDSIVASMQPTDVDLTMPRFDTETRADLGPVLAAMGMPTAFDPDQADFSGITSEVALFIRLVIHQANITVDEAGTEAAAATVILMGDTSGPGGSGPIELRVDRPFLFLIRDVPTGAVVFMGRVADPSDTR